ncbi:MAG TPA: YlxR family protein [Glaciihabitans sp.]|jgi:predicted RNA-binding protein YlxR (DUF448 family)|nr:YlxR family protein [Glaciihabitans sp.]
MEPVRTCLGCRLRADKSTLLRVVAAGGAVIPDPSATLPGRGAWVHPTTECIEKAIARKTFGRAFRVSSALDTEKVRAVALHATSPETVGTSSEAPQRTG